MAPQQFQPQSNTASRPTQSSGTSIQTVTSATQTLQSQPTQNPRQMNQMPPSGTTFSFGSPATVTPTRNPHQTPSWTSHHSYTSHGTSTAASSFLSRLRQAAYGQSQATPTANFANPPSQSAQSLTTASGRPAPGQTITVVRPQVQPTTRPVISNGSASAAAAATTQTFRNLPVFNYPSASSMNGPSASSTTSSAQALLQLREYFLQTYGVGSISARHPHSYSNSAPRFMRPPSHLDEEDDDDDDGDEIDIMEEGDDEFPSRSSSHHHSGHGHSHYTRPGHDFQTWTRPEEPTPYSQFRYKIVCRLNCRSCDRLLCERGMKAILLADTKIELYSTDAPPSTDVAMVNEDYATDNCRCRIHDIACLGCGNVVGYHVTQPCDSCLDSCNNGHFWMFHLEGVVPSERPDGTGSGKPLLWAFLPPPDRDMAALTQKRMVPNSR